MFLGFVVQGQPKPWARARRRGNNYFNDSKVEKYKGIVKQAAEHAVAEFESRFGAWPLDGIYAVTVVVHRENDRRFDCDRMLNTVADACVGVLYEDDRNKFLRDARVLVGAPSKVEPYIAVLVHAYDGNEHRDKVEAMERTIERVGMGMV